MNSSKLLTKEEQQSLIDTLKRYENRDTLMLYLLFKYGMRSGELLSLRVCDINKAGPSILIHGSKGSRDREFPIELGVFKRLLAQCEGKDSLDLVFDIGYRQLYRIWEMYRPVKKKLHSLRHGVAFQVYQKSKDLVLTQQVLGHRSIKTTMVYQSYSYGQEQFKKVLL